MTRGRGVVRSHACALAVLALLVAAPVAHAAYPGVNGQLAFVSARDGNYEIYSSDPAGAVQTNLTANVAGDLFPAWSPNGAKVAFATFRDGGNEEIYVMNADGTNPTRLTTSAGMDADPAWSPDGSKIAFRSDRDGNFEIYVMDADGSDETNVSNDPGVDDRPAWSPDGSRIAFETDRDGDFEIYAMNPDGTNQTDLSNDAANDRRPNWAPYTSRIAFDSSRDGNLEIYSMSENGSGQTRLTSNTTDDSEPAWSPDESRIVFRSQRDGNAEIYTMTSAGGNETRVTTNTAYEAQPDWQPASTGYPRPKGAGPLRVSLVPGYQPCVVGNRTHGPPLAFPSCNPPLQTSPNLTIGTPDSNGAGSNSTGWARFTPKVGVSGPPDDSDIRVAVSVSDVRCKAVLPPCTGSALSDYTGELELDATFRITDRFNGASSSGGSEPATVSDLKIPVPVPCSPTVSGTTGALCSVSTTVNTVMPGAITDTKRTVVEMGQVQVMDGGLDGAASTADNSVFAVQGVFAP